MCCSTAKRACSHFSRTTLTDHHLAVELDPDVPLVRSLVFEMTAANSRLQMFIVSQGNLLDWHRTGFRLYWRWRARPTRRPTEAYRRDSQSDPTLSAREFGR